MRRLGRDQRAPPGVIITTLQALEDQGFVRGTTEDNGKRVYSVTDEGLAYLEQHAEEVREQRSRMGSRFGRVNKEELHDTIRDMRKLSEDIRHAIHGLMNDPEKRKAWRSDPGGAPQDRRDHLRGSLSPGPERQKVIIGAVFGIALGGRLQQVSSPRSAAGAGRTSQTGEGAGGPALSLC